VKLAFASQPREARVKLRGARPRGRPASCWRPWRAQRRDPKPAAPRRPSRGQGAWARDL